MKLLIVMACNPFNPQSGSENIAFNNIIRLTENHYIDVVSLDITNKKSRYESNNLNLIIVAEKKKLSKWLRKMFSRIYFAPSVTAYISFEMRRMVSILMEQNKYDAVLLYELFAMQYCNKSFYNKIILNIEDPPSIKMKGTSSLPVWTKTEKLILNIRSKLERLCERYFLPKVAKVLLLSKADLDDMHKKGFRGNYGLVTYGTTHITDSEIVPYEKRRDGMIVFSGNMFHPPNIDGALFFLHKIFSTVLEECPATLWIVGANPDKRILDAAARFGERVVITGRVDDVSKYIKVAKVSICPVRLKIGVQTKILEALSCGTPVVTTSAGNSGICGVSGKALWVEDDPSIFSSRVASLLKGESWDRFSKEGRKLAATNFTWERSASELEQHIKEVCFNRAYPNLA